MNLSQYVLEPLRVDEEFVLYRARHSSEHSLPSILVLAPASEHPSPVAVRKIEHEYSLRHELESAWAIRPLTLSQRRGRPVLTLEDPGGDTLEKPLSGPMETAQFLRAAVGLATALGGLHGRRLIHKDVKPANVLVNLATGQIRLMGFGIASRLPRERQTPQPPETIAGTLAYMAPEQTGRMNRSIDARSDLYALGVTLYEMVTGSLPFAAVDPMEWVHCHIARQALPPDQRVTHVPPPVSAIIMKLLAKTPEERYQTAAGLERDLQRCLSEWETRGTVDEFALGDADFPDRLLMPERLYGRESHIGTLLATFDVVVAGGNPRLVLVSGPAGIGKSSLVNELHKVLVPPQGLFASGKVEHLKRDIPYATLAQAIRSLIRRLWSLPEAELRTWRDHLHEALDPNGAPVLELIPELKFMIGEQPSVADLPGHAAKVRFKLAFRRLISVFARPDHPLVLFLDDLQWLDTDTLDLLEDLLGQAELQHLLIVGACRDNEVDDAHPLTRTLATIRKAGAQVQEIVLAPLHDDDLAHLIADALRCEPQRAMPLARLVLEKTGGNPFFANQFIQELVDERLLIFDSGRGAWRWDLGSIRAKGFTDNVVELMVGKLSRLPDSTQEAAKELACLGNSAEASMLASVHGTSEEELHSDLWEALRQELIVHADHRYRFVHDRVHEAAYSLIPEERRAPTHLRIGRLLTAKVQPEKREDIVFEIVGQLNRGSALVTSREDRLELAALNLMAGKRAKTTAAYASALTYFAAGAALLPEDSWERQHDLVFELELHRASCHFLTGRIAAAEERLVTLSPRATSAVERSAVACLLADIYFTRQRPDLGVAACLECLGHAGLDFPMPPTDEQAQAAYDRTLSRVEGRSIDELADLPVMIDPASRATLDVLAKVIPCAVSMSKNLLTLIICAAVDLSLGHGNCDSSCIAYEYFGFVAGELFGNVKAGFRFGQLGYEVAERKGLRQFDAVVRLAFASQAPWARHDGTSGHLIRSAFTSANKTGDPLAAAASRSIFVWYVLVAGEPLVEAQKETEAALEVHRKLGLVDLVDSLAVQAAYIRSLRGLTPHFGSLDDDRFDERQMERAFSTQPHLPVLECKYWIRKLQVRFMAGDYLAALDASIRAQPLLCATPVLIMRAEHEFYSALTRAAVSDSQAADERRAHLRALAAHGRRLEACARECPENFADRAALVAAEIARIEGRHLDAERLYEDAIRAACEREFVHNEALANELAARFYAARGFETIAQAYLRNARYAYLRWGADGKVRQLDQLHPQLSVEETSTAQTGTIEAPLEQLDLATVIKVSQAIAGEMVQEKLLDTVMRTAMEHAGAERALLMLSGGAEQRIVAEATTSADAVVVRLRDEPVTAAMLPETIFRYVLHTQESVILDDAASLNPFTTDSYFSARHVRSVLCLPLTNQAKLIGALYLENSLAPHVFAPARIAVLKLLACQAAISLDNSRLYRDLGERERESRTIVDSIPGLVSLMGTAGEVELLNHRMLEYFGKTLEEMRRWGEGDIIHPVDLPHVIKALEEAIACGTPLEYEARLQRFDGVHRWFQVRAHPARDSAGRVARWYVLITDIDDLKRAEELLAGEKRLLEMVASGHSLEDVLQTMCGFVDTVVGRCACSILLIDSDGTFRPGAGPTLPPGYDGSVNGAPVACEAGPCGTAASLNEQVIVPDLVSEPRWIGLGWRTLVLEHGLRSVCSTPIVSSTGQVLGTFAIYQREPGSPSALLTDLIARFTNVASIAIERAINYRDLQERERESRKIVDSIPGLVARLSPAGEVEVLNHRMLEYLGKTPEEIKRWEETDIVHPADLPNVIEVFAQAIASGVPLEYEARLRRFDGVHRWFQVRGLPARDSAGRIARWYFLLTDIDDLKRTEAELGALKDQLYQENLVLRDEVDRTSMFEEIVGTSPALQPVLARVAKVARTESTVLITGETGTGKELVARAIHRRSARASRAFVSVNCAAVPRELIASELFGHEKGAFTGATQRRFGRFELAQGGTIFLDEVGELPMETQLALLRVLQEREFERVGGTSSVRVDVRVVAATNRDLDAAIEAGVFRRDLFYRLNVFPIAVPALRERADDIPLLVEYFIDRYSRKTGKTIRRVNKRTLDRLRSYLWPGNVRELQNVIERSVIVCDTDEFAVDDSWLSTRPAIERPLALSGTLAAHEKGIIEDALRACGGRVFGPSGAAERLGIPRSTLESRIRALRINKSRFRSRLAKS